VASWAALYFGFHWLIERLAEAGIAGSTLGWIALPVDILITALLYCSFYPIYTSIFKAPPASDSTSDQPGMEQ
jgi:hypothetical protein